MNDGSIAPRLWWRNRLVLGVLVFLLVASGIVLAQSLRAGTAGAAGAQGAPSIFDSSVRFRILAQSLATPNPAQFTLTSYVVPNHRAVNITDVVLQNPHGDAGTMRIQIGDEVILEENLSNLQDQHFPIPLHVNADQPVKVAVSCQLPGPPQPVTGTCAPSASFFG